MVDEREHRQSEHKDRKRFWRNWLIALCIFAGIAFAAGIFLPSFLANKLGSDVAELRGQIGDSFGLMNALMSTAAFAGLIITLLMQREELELTREEMADNRRVMELQASVMQSQLESALLGVEIQERALATSVIQSWYSNDRSASKILDDGDGDISSPSIRNRLLLDLSINGEIPWAVAGLVSPYAIAANGLVIVAKGISFSFNGRPVSDREESDSIIERTAEKSVGLIRNLVGLLLELPLSDARDDAIRLVRDIDENRLEKALAGNHGQRRTFETMNELKEAASEFKNALAAQRNVLLSELGRDL